MALTLRQLKYFVATAELGQISQAAIQLTISQSAVTSAIRELEDSLGTQLFVRTASGVALTNTGRRFLNQAIRSCRRSTRRCAFRISKAR